MINATYIRPARNHSCLAQNWQDVVLASILFSVLCPQSAWAYLDPSAGSALMQMAYAGWLTAAYILIRLQRHIREFIREIVKRFDHHGDYR